uniref:Uncharacterized protein n=1 Tax=Cacopsylla melanoneura TaxID=428564 RepID=A0A8D8M7H0_9HEMI
MLLTLVEISFPLPMNIAAIEHSKLPLFFFVQTPNYRLLKMIHALLKIQNIKTKKHIFGGSDQERGGVRQDMHQPFRLPGALRIQLIYFVSGSHEPLIGNRHTHTPSIS